jgi:hypothetical protein
MDSNEFHFSIPQLGKIAKWLVWTIKIIFYVIAGARDKFPVDFLFNLWFDSSQLLQESRELTRVKDQVTVNCG